MAKRFFRIFNWIHIFLYRSTSGRVGGRIQGLQVLLLTTTGRRTRKERTAPLGAFEEGGAYIITASNAGFDVHPGWFLNLRSDPRVRIQVGAKTTNVQARILEGAERERLWDRLVALSPGYRRYERSTQRAIPLIALRRGSHPE